MAVQVRGGPEPYMVTSWVQIMELRPTDSGTYTCVAKNSEGEVRAAATLGVNKVKSVTPGKPKSNKNKKPPTTTNTNQSPKTAQADQQPKKQVKDIKKSASATKDPKGKAKKAKSNTVA